MRIPTKRVSVTVLAMAVCGLALVLATTPGAEAGDGTLVRPISDFLDAQMWADGGPYWIGNPSQKDLSYSSRVDYLGVINRDFLIPKSADLETEFTGKVTERVLTDGRTEVHVVLHGKNVFFVVWVPGTGYVAGRSFRAHPAPNNLPVATCTTRFDLKYITMNAPGEPMPRLAPLLFNTPVGWDILQTKLTAHGACELRAAYGVEDGTPGRFTLNMVGLIHPKGGDITQDETFPVGNIMLRPVGN